MWKLGYMVSRIGTMTDFRTQLDWLRDAGFQAVQIGAGAGAGDLPCGLDPSQLDAKARQTVKDQLARFPVFELHAMTPLPPQEPLAAVEGFVPLIELAAEVGASILTIHGHAPDRQAGRDNAVWRKAVERLDALAGEAGVLIGLENLPEYEAFRGPRRPNVGVTLDIGHARLDMGHCWPGTLGDLVRYLGDTLVHMHVHDFDGTTVPLPDGKVHDHQELGTGVIDFDDLLRALAEVQYQGALLLELNENHVSPEAIIRNRDWLQSKIAALGFG